MINVRSKIRLETKLLLSFSYLVAFFFVIVFFYFEGDKWSLEDTHVIFIFAGVPSLLLTLSTMFLGRLSFIGVSDKSVYIKDDISLKETWYFEIPYEMISHVGIQSEMFTIILTDGEAKKISLKYLVLFNEKNESLSMEEVVELIQNKVSVSGNKISHVRRIGQTTLEKLLNDQYWYNNFFLRGFLILCLLGALYFLLNRF